MKRVTRHIRVAVVAILTLMLGVFPTYTSAAAPAPNLILSYAERPSLLITELQTNGGSNASQEFIEIYNTTDQDITFGNATTAGSAWKLQIFKTPAAGAIQAWLAPTNAIELTGTISAHDYLIVSRKGYAPAGMSMSGQVEYGTATSNYLIDSGGALQVVEIPDTAKQQTVLVHDQLEWLPKPAGGATLPLGTIETPAGGKSSQRMTNDNNEYLAIDNTATDYAEADTISPLEAWLPPEPVLPPPLPDAETDETGGAGDMPTDGVLTSDPADNTGLADPRVTEALPNPAAPLTDAADEFIELYNPNNAPFDLKGYALEVGTTTLHDFTLTSNAVMPAYSYIAFYSADTKLSLTNSGGQAKLLAPSGVVVSESAVYGAAADNTSWSQIDGTWQWTTSATPGVENLLTIVPVVSKTATSKAAKATAIKKAATTKAKGTTTAKKAAAKKATTKKAAKKKTATKKATTLATAASVKPKPPIHTGILVAVAVAAVLYGLYEYRHDISNKFHQLRGNRASRRKNGGQAAWRRSYSTE